MFTDDLEVAHTLIMGFHTWTKKNQLNHQTEKVTHISSCKPENTFSNLDCLFELPKVFNGLFSNRKLCSSSLKRQFHESFEVPLKFKVCY